MSLNYILENHKDITSATYWNVHNWLKKNYGKANKCENLKCPRISKSFQWAKKTDRKYDFKRNNFWQLCRSCHAIYDITAATRQKISMARKGKPLTLHARNAISKKMMGRKRPQNVINKIIKSKRKLAKQFYFKGQNKSLKDWAEILNIPYAALFYRINTAKWSIEKSLSTPLKIYEFKRN